MTRQVGDRGASTWLKTFASLSRAVLYQLEALEPRRFLSAGDVGDAVAIDEAGTTIAGEYSGADQVRLRFNAEAGESYVFSHLHVNHVRMSVLSEDGSAALAATPLIRENQFERRLDWPAPSSGTYLLEVAQVTDERWRLGSYEINARVADDRVGDVPGEAAPIDDHTDVKASSTVWTTPIGILLK